MRHRELALGSALKLKAEQDRKAAMGRVADGFEQAIGKIVQAVSSEIEVAAGNLNRTAEANNTLIVTASSASDRASENAQSAAAASERMASSVIEIGRQVQLSENITETAGGCLADVSRGSADAQTAALQVHGFARSLSQQGNALKIEVGKFLETVRAA
jgi:methyl-accepting chemotaxis protein